MTMNWTLQAGSKQDPEVGGQSTQKAEAAIGSSPKSTQGE